MPPDDRKPSRQRQRPIQREQEQRHAQQLVSGSQPGALKLGAGSRKAVSVYLNYREEHAIRLAAGERGMDLSGFMRASAVFEAKLGTLDLIERVDRGDSAAKLELVNNALRFAGMEVADLAPPQEPERIEVIRTVEVIRNVEVVRYVEVPAPAVVPALTHLPAERGAAVAQEALIAPDPPSSSQRLLELASELGASLIASISAAVDWAHRGRNRAAPRKKRWSPFPERPTTAATYAAVGLALLIPPALPMDLGRGALGYMLLGGGADGWVEAVYRAPPKISRRVLAGFAIMAGPQGSGPVERCLEKAVARGRPVKCTIEVPVTR